LATELQESPGSRRNASQPTSFARFSAASNIACLSAGVAVFAGAAEAPSVRAGCDDELLLLGPVNNGACWAVLL
jgi:hypothetical protein